SRRCSFSPRNGSASTCSRKATAEATAKNTNQWKMIRRESAPCTHESINRCLRRGKPMDDPLKTKRRDGTTLETGSHPLRKLSSRAPACGRDESQLENVWRYVFMCHCPQIQNDRAKCTVTVSHPAQCIWVARPESSKGVV